MIFLKKIKIMIKKYIFINHFYCHKKYRYKGLGIKLFLYFLLKQPKKYLF